MSKSLSDNWAWVRESGLGAVIVTGSPPKALAAEVRGAGLRYLGLRPCDRDITSPSELTIATAWAQSRIVEGNAVLLCDAGDAAAAAFLAAATLLRLGTPLHVALERLKGVRPEPFDEEQFRLLVALAARARLKTRPAI